MTADRRVPTPSDIDDAARRIAPFVIRTPMLRSPWLSDAAAAEVWIKLENVQVTGSFKYRGAANAIARLVASRPDVRAVMTASAGNHGLALTTAAARMDVRTRVHLPATAPAAKREAMAALGAEIVEAASYDAAEDAARAEVAARAGDAVFVSPYDDFDVIAGAGTVGLEMLDDVPDLDVIVVPVGGGGLISGIAIEAAGRKPAARVVGAEASQSPVFTAAIAAGRPVTVDVGPTLADGLAGNMDPASRTFAIVRDLVAGVVAVDEASIAAAMRGLVYRDRVVAEGAGAVGVAAVLAGGPDLSGRRIGIVISGRNVDAAVLARVIV